MSTLIHTRILVPVALSVSVGCATSLEITSRPAGARILIDGKDTGDVTPDTIRPRKLPSGNHEVTVVLDGRESPPGQRINVALSVGTIVWSILWPPAGIINLFKGFSSVEPEELSFNFDQGGYRAAAHTPKPTTTSEYAYSGQRRRLKGKDIKCAVLPMKLLDVSKGMAHVIDDFLLSELQAAGFEAIGRDDLDAMVDFENTKEALDCDEATCMAEIGNALGVPYLVAGKVAGAADSRIITLKLLDVRNSRVLARETAIGEGTDRAIPALIAQAVQGLVSQSGL